MTNTTTATKEVGMTIKRLTFNQRQALEKIRIIQEVRARRIREEYPNGMDGKPVIPSGWLPMYTLNDTHKIPMNVLNQLFKKGALLRRSTDGFGPEVKPA